MERLLADATKLTGVKYDINNLSDVYEAIHAVQEEMGITGTTAKEASETFSGSFAAMKASLSNVLGNLALGKNIKPQLTALAETTSTFLFDNFIPMVVNILKGVPEVFGTIATEAAKRFADYLNIDFDFSGIKLALDEAFSAFGGVDGVIEGLKNALSGLYDALKNIATVSIGAVSDFLKWLASPSGEVARALLVGLGTALGIVGGALLIYNAAMAIAGAVTSLFAGAIALLTSPITLIVAAIAALITAAILLYQNWETVKAKATEIWGAIKDKISEIVEGIKTAVSDKFNQMKDGINNIVNATKAVINNIWNAISSYISGVVNSIKTTVSNIWNTIKNTTSSVFNSVKSTISSIWNGIKSTITRVVNGIKSTVTNIWNGIKSTTSSVFNGIKSTATSVWNGVKSAMTRPIEAARDTIKRIIDKIKGFFSGMNLKIPSIKMPKLPHFSLTGKFSLNPPSVPKLGITWNAKGGIFTRPTIFGMNGGNLQGAGEAGAEAVLPLNSRTLAGIGKGISDEMGGSSSQIELLERKLEQMIALLTLLANQDTTIEMDDKTVAKILAPIIKQINDKKELLKNRGKGLITT